MAKAKNTGLKEPKMVEFEVTEAYLAVNPELAENDINVGDIIEITEEEAKVASGELKEIKTDALKGKGKAKSGAMAVLKNEKEYVRTYSADQEAELTEFLSKDSAYSAVPDASIESVDVPYEVKQKDGSINRTSKRFTDKAEAIRFKNEHRSTCLVGTMKK